MGPLWREESYVLGELGRAVLLELGVVGLVCGRLIWSGLVDVERGLGRS